MMLRQRVITAVFIVIIILAVLMFSHIPLVVMSFAALLGLIAVHELYAAAGFLKSRWAYALSLMIAAVLPFIRIPYYNIALTALFAAAAALFFLLMRNLGRYAIDKAGKVFALSLMIPLFFSSIAYLRPVQDGLYWIILVLLACVGADSAAYFTGSLLGRHKLAGKISPKKTVEGFAGGLIFTALLFLGFGIMLRLAYEIKTNLVILALLGLFCGAAAQFGDLSMSVLKRNFGVKDFGKIMPGHGGVLDRFDSMMFVAPLIYIVASFCGEMFAG